MIGQLGLSTFDASSRQNLKFARGQRTDHRSSKLKAFAVFFRPTFQLLVSLLHIAQAKMGNESSVTYGTKLLNDIKVEWKNVETQAKLPSRDGHCAAAMANKLYVFGGVRWLSDISESTESNEILVFDVGKLF